MLGDDHNNEYQLTYKLNDHQPAQIWADIIKSLDPSTLRNGLNPWRGRAKDLDPMVLELNELIDSLNQWIPEKIDSRLDPLNIKENLNKLHIHFPELEKQYFSDLDKQKQLTRYNDLIHGIEQAYYASVTNQNHLRLLLCLPGGRDLIADDDFKLFDPNINWGDLVLHYPHVGRHPLELFLNNDQNCPPDQIIPQTEISPFHTLRFHEYKFSAEKFKLFYNSKKLCFPYLLDDPKLAIGYIKLGRIVSDDKQDKITELVNKCSKIIHWEIE